MSKKLDDWSQRVTDLFGEISSLPPAEQKQAKSIMRSLCTDSKSSEPIVNQDEIDFISDSFADRNLD